MRGKRSFRSGSGRKSRRMEWTSTAITSPASTGIPAFGTALTFSEYIVAPSVLASEFVDPTLVRLRGQLSLQLVTGGAVPVAVQGAFGLITWKDPDDTAPIGADAPSPLLDGEFDWIYHQFINWNAPGAAPGEGRIYGWTDAGAGRSIDSKAMRRCPTGFGLLFVMVLQKSDVADTAADLLAFGGGFRALWKE